jgi:hypothetical protein
VTTERLTDAELRDFERDGCSDEDFHRLIAEVRAARASRSSSQPPPESSGDLAEIERLVDVLMASVELDGFHSDPEDEPAACRAALLSALRRLASPRAPEGGLRERVEALAKEWARDAAADDADLKMTRTRAGGRDSEVHFATAATIRAGHAKALRSALSPTPTPNKE